MNMDMGMNHEMSGLLTSHLLEMAGVRGLWLLGLVLIIGMTGFRLFVLDPVFNSLWKNGKEVKLREKADQFTQWLMGGSLLLLTLVSFMALIQESSMMSHKAIGQVFPVLPLVLKKTHWGVVWTGRAILLAGFFALWGFYFLRKSFSPLPFFILSIFISVTFSLISHAADSGDLTWRIVMDTVHLVMVSLWLGGLVPLRWLSPKVVQLDNPQMTPYLTRIIERFSALATLCVITIISTGIYTVWKIWGKFPNLDLILSSNYGELFLIKIAFVGLVLFLGALSRFYILPGLRKVSPGTSSPLVPRFFIFITIEIILVVGTLSSAFLLMQSTPPKVEKESARNHNLQWRQDLLQSSIAQSTVFLSENNKS